MRRRLGIGGDVPQNETEELIHPHLPTLGTDIKERKQSDGHYSLMQNQRCRFKVTYLYIFLFRTKIKALRHTCLIRFLFRKIRENEYFLKLISNGPLNRSERLMRPVIKYVRI